MELKDFMAISGYPGLFRFVSQGRNSIIVESIEDKKRMSAYSTSRISTLEEIAVFTTSGEMPLAELLTRMYENSGGSEALSHKSSPEDIREYFETVLPEYDREKVYVSDMKKIVNWFNILVRHDLLIPAQAEGDEKPDTSGDNPVDDTGKDPSTG